MSCLWISPWQFIEKKRELKQNGRTDAELEESYGFLLPDKDKVSFCSHLVQVNWKVVMSDYMDKAHQSTPKHTN